MKSLLIPLAALIASPFHPGWYAIFSLRDAGAPVTHRLAADYSVQPQPGADFQLTGTIHQVETMDGILYQWTA